MSIDYSNEIIQAVDILISQRLNEVSFDKTEICTIISKDLKDDTTYWVSNGQIKYQAKSQTGVTYEKGIKVYVTIPQGKYEMGKIIIGKYESDNKEQIKLYTNPFDNFIKSYSFYSNNNSHTANVNISLKGRPYFNYTNTTYYSSGFGTPEYLGLRFNAYTKSKVDNPSGDFLIMIELLDAEGNELIPQDYKGLLTFSSQNLTGNPYNLSKDIWYEHLFPFPIKISENEVFDDLSKIATINYLLIDTTNGQAFEEIEIENIEFYAGYDKKNISSNSVVLTTSGEMEYTPEEELNRTFYIDWVYKDQPFIYNNQFLCPELTNYTIYLLRYAEGYPKNLNKGDIAESGVYWQTISSSALSDSTFIMTGRLSQSNKKEEFKIGIKGPDNYYVESNVLRFDNTHPQQEEVNLGNLDIDNLILYLDEGDDGIYNLYGYDNKITINGSMSLNHNVHVRFADSTSWDSVEHIEWRIPSSATMLETPTSYDEDTGKFVPVDDWVLNEEQNCYIYANNDTTTSIEQLKSTIFSIKKQFDFAKTNNTISCHIVLLDGTKYQGRLRLQFGTQGIAGSPYSFNIYADGIALFQNPGIMKEQLKDKELTEEEEKALTENEITFTVRLENTKGELISLDEYEVQWYYKSGDKEISIPNNGAEKTKLTINSRRDLSVYTDNKYEDKYIYSTVVDDKGTETLYYCETHYLVLMAKLMKFTNINGEDIDLIAYYPLARTLNKNYCISGPSSIIYSAQGNSSVVDKNPYVLYERNSLGQYKQIDNVEWSIETDSQYEAFDAASHFPSLDKNGHLQPLASIPSILPCSIVARDENKKMLYCQPLIVSTNAYASPDANAWDGKTLTINEKDAKIMTSFIGAGKKNKGKYSGVLMGSVKLDDINTVAQTGLYGFKDGVMRFKLDENGDFYVGSSSDNRITFDNMNGLEIKTNQFNLSAKYGSLTTLEISSNGGADGRPYMKIGDWTIDNRGIYTRGSNGWDNAPTGMSGGMGATAAFWAGYYYDEGLKQNIYSFRINPNGTGNIGSWNISPEGYLYTTTKGTRPIYDDSGKWTGETENVNYCGVGLIGGHANNSISDAAFYAGYDPSKNGNSLYPTSYGGWVEEDIVKILIQRDGTIRSRGDLYFGYSEDDKDYLFKFTEKDGLKIQGSGTFTGTIQAASGKIGYNKDDSTRGWNISSGALTNGALGSRGSIHLYTSFPDEITHAVAGVSGHNWRILAGSNFGVDRDGNLYCNNATIKGTLQTGTSFITGDATASVIKSAKGREIDYLTSTGSIRKTMESGFVIESVDGEKYGSVLGFSRMIVGMTVDNYPVIYFETAANAASGSSACMIISSGNIRQKTN